MIATPLRRAFLAAALILAVTALIITLAQIISAQEDDGDGDDTAKHSCWDHVFCATHASAARSNINAASNVSAVLHLASLYLAMFVGHVHAQATPKPPPTSTPPPTKPPTNQATAHVHAQATAHVHAQATTYATTYEHAQATVHATTYEHAQATAHVHATTYGHGGSYTTPYIDASADSHSSAHKYAQTCTSATTPSRANEYADADANAFPPVPHPNPGPTPHPTNTPLPTPTQVPLCADLARYDSRWTDDGGGSELVNPPSILKIDSLKVLMDGTECDNASVFIGGLLRTERYHIVLTTTDGLGSTRSAVPGGAPASPTWRGIGPTGTRSLSGRVPGVTRMGQLRRRSSGPHSGMRWRRKRTT